MRTLSGKARLAGVLGWPVSHSRSPRLHGFWLARHGVDGAYLPLPVRPERFEAAVKDIPEILECHLVTGEYDYVIKAAVGGTAGYERLLRDRLYRLPGVRHTRTSFALRSLKQEISPLPE